MLTLATPANLCGSFQQSSTTVTQDVTFNAENDERRPAGDERRDRPNTYTTPAFASGVATFSAVDFDPGQNDVTATATDPAGNATTLAPVPCSVTIGSAPVVTFTTPTAGQILCPTGSTTPGCLPDADGSTPGWQGTLTAHVTADGLPVTSGTVTFTVGTTTLGTATLDASGNASLAGVTLPEGTITIVATTSNIPSSGVGTGSVTVTVDLGVPGADEPDGDGARSPADVDPACVDRAERQRRLGRRLRRPLREGADHRRQLRRHSGHRAVTYTGSPAAPGAARRHRRDRPVHRDRLLLRGQGARRRGQHQRHRRRPDPRRGRTS